MGRWWGDLSDRNRNLFIAGAIVEAILKTAVLIDISRWPRGQLVSVSRLRSFNPQAIPLMERRHITLARW